MKRYKNEGFKFIGIARLSQDFKVEPELVTYNKNGQ